MQLLWGLKDSNLAIVMTSILTDVNLYFFFFYLMQSFLIEPKKDDDQYYPVVFLVVSFLMNILFVV